MKSEPIQRQRHKLQKQEQDKESEKMLGEDLAKWLFNAIRKLLKPALKFGHALGVEWMLILYWVPFSMAGKSNTLWFYIALSLTVAQLVLNLYCKVKGEKARNLIVFATIHIVKNLKGEGAKGIIAKLNTENVQSISGMVFGKKGGNYVTKKEQEDGHALVIGGAGSGKSSGIAIPTLMSWKNRAFVIDIKGELYEKTKKVRGEDSIKVFNPSDEFACGYNPYYVLEMTDDLCSTAHEIAESIIPLSPDVKEPMWIKNARDFLCGAILYFYDKGKNFSETMIAIKSQSAKSLVAEVMESGIQEAITYMSTFADMADETLSGVFTEVSINITPFATNKALIRVLGSSSNAITPNDLENGNDVFICIEEHKLEQWKTLLTMMVNQFCKFFEQRKNDNNTPILFMLDEFPRLGKIESVATGLATLRSKKIEIMLYVQSKNQLDMIYGKEQAGSICDNCTYKVILKASEPATQKWCSDLVGTFDKIKKSNSTNANAFGMGSGSGVSTTTEEKRIIKPEEFAYLQDVVCIFPTGYNRITKIKWWEDKYFSKYS